MSLRISFSSNVNTIPSCLKPRVLRWASVANRALTRADRRDVREPSSRAEKVFAEKNPGRSDRGCLGADRTRQTSAGQRSASTRTVLGPLHRRQPVVRIVGLSTEPSLRGTVQRVAGCAG